MKKNLLLLTVSIILFSCSKDSPGSGSGGWIPIYQPPPPPPPPPPPRVDMASFWIRDPYGFDDAWTFYPNGLASVTVNNLTQPLSYTLNENWDQICGSNQTANFSLPPGTYNWLAAFLPSGAIKEGTVSVVSGRCTVVEIR